MLHSNSIESLLRANHHLGILPDDMISKIAVGARFKNLDKGQLLFSKEDSADALYIVIDGNIAIELLSRSGKIMRVSNVNNGMLLGELGVLDEGLRTADARATIKSTLIRIGGNNFRDIVKSNAAFSFHLMSGLIAKLRSTDILVEDVSFRTLRSRIAIFLMAQIDHNKDDDMILGAHNNIELMEVEMTQSELSDCVGASREKVNNHLRVMEKMGAIALTRGRICILDINELVKLTE